ncbi:MAGa3780 family membrane protein [Mycoplasma corogypsi]|uniref:MAGa3780 family membrane protein n=1 Tax=Mycoplasma corogypsi TaxID=2106 RepID=UPI003872E15E
MKNTLKFIIDKSKSFTAQDWATFLIGLFLIVSILTTTFLEWYFVSVRAKIAFDEIRTSIENSGLTDAAKNLIYPNATRLFWGGSTYWFTFMSNTFMSVILVIYPLINKSQKAQRLYFASIIYIILVASAYWTGVTIVPSIFTHTFLDEKIKTLLMHAVGPILGISTLFWEKRRISVSNRTIWTLMVFPVGYLFIMIIPTYIFGYKFKEFGGTELQRGIIIYPMISFDNPFDVNQKGAPEWVKIFLDIMIVVLAFISAPMVGALVRKMFFIRKPGQNPPERIFFIHPSTRNIIQKLKLEAKKRKKSFLVPIDAQEEVAQFEQQLKENQNKEEQEPSKQETTEK